MWRKIYYQYYTNVTYLTCPECLSRHGKILKDPARLPKRKDRCERKLLAFPRKELKAYRQKARQMRARAEAELRRRELVRGASDTLGLDNEKAIDLFRQAARIDLYVPEIEELRRTKDAVFSQDPALRETLRMLFARAYSDKFGWPRYERLPERMRIVREQAGVERIKELFA
jgi:thioesterase domain-containing protein